MFAARLEEIMRRRNLTDPRVADLVRKTGLTMTRQYVTQLRTGVRTDPGISRVKALASVLDVPVWWLLGEDDPAEAAPFASLSNESRAALAAVLDLARRADRLPSVGQPPGQAGARRAEAAEIAASDLPAHPYPAEQVRQAIATSEAMPPNRVGARLRSLRTEAGLSVAEAELVIGGEPGLLDQIETGTLAPSTAMLRLLLSSYGVTDPYHQALFISAAQGHLDSRWWLPYFQTLPLWVVAFMEMEDSSELIRYYSSSEIPFLLQHPDYTRMLRLAAHHPDAPAAQIELGTRLLRERQERLVERRKVNIWAVIQKSVLLDPVGGIEVQIRQLDHLITMAAQPHVSIQINVSGPDRYRPRGGSFTLLRRPDPSVPDVAWIPHLSEDTMIADSTHMAEYSMAWARLTISATPPDQAIHMLTQARAAVAQGRLSPEN
ncbi:Scr1 family TA system antitoxin-like transcriptional regulator [[Actinomadura] parvosata]|uniref:Scr1 family TA system antitoxin-like transcriptional regulator n=1 Tax=[Actinomadura] parvosata TaxID=1955412 RepID=UPI00406CE854